jgi:hypothetical protein
MSRSFFILSIVYCLTNSCYSQNISALFEKKDSIPFRIRVPITNNNLTERFGFTETVKTISEEIGKGNLQPFFSDSIKVSDQKITLDNFIFISGTDLSFENKSYRTSFLSDYSWSLYEDFQRITNHVILILPWEKQIIQEGYKSKNHPLNSLLNSFEIEGILFKNKNKIEFLPSYIILWSDKNNLTESYFAINLQEFINKDGRASIMKHYFKKLNYTFEIKSLDEHYLDKIMAEKVKTDLMKKF